MKAVICSARSRASALSGRRSASAFSGSIAELKHRERLLRSVVVQGNPAGPVQDVGHQIRCARAAVGSAPDYPMSARETPLGNDDTTG